ncbi:S-layer homology domain-containing protein [Cohnella soli]|uniref:S-layer homology domain-containing protein n=1 Tax=Cohnella soli TaxID=425005 RepID=A0ABW0HYM0_9BACL
MKMIRKLTSTAIAFALLCMLALPSARVAAHQATTIEDELSDVSKVFSYTANWTIDGSNPQFFGGDAARIVRTSKSTESVVYHLSGIQSFSVQAFYFSGSTGVIKFYGSSDATTWTEIPSDYADPYGTGSGWYGTVYSPSAALQSGIDYLKIEISGDIDTWLMQIGSVSISNVSLAPQTINDELTDVSKIHSQTANWSIDGSNPAFFGGDASRIVRTTVSAEFIVYHLHGIKNFSARIHSFAGSTAAIKFYGSSDGSAWTEIPSNHDTPVSTGDGAWTGTTYSPAGNLPAGVDYLKIEVSGDPVPWAVQLGSVSVSNVAPGGGSSGGEGDYFVDSAAGSDNNDGKSQSTAWKTFANVNNTTFAAGDRILLRKGGVWNERLYPKGSGTSDAPITISSYGSGGKPIINGGGMAGGAVYLRNPSNWIVQNLEVTNFTAERGNIYREGIMVENANGGTLSNIQILDNYVHDVSSSFRYPTGSGAEGGPHAFGGISVYVGGTTAADKFDNVLIQGNTVERIGRTGIVVWDQRWNGTGYASTNVKIRQNYVKQADSDGILTFGADGALIERNVAEGGGNYSEPGEFNGSAAIWPTRGKNNVVQFNESFNTNKPEGDGQGFNLDIDSTDSVVQYNYSHDNKGGFMLFVDARLSPGVFNGSSNSVVRYNISQNDLTHTFNFAGGVTPGTQIYNNTIYIGTGQNTKIIDHEWNDAGDLNAAYSFKNNIVYNLGSGGYNIPGSNGVFDRNLFYGNHPLTEPADSNKITANPLLVYQGGGGKGWNTVDGYKLRAGSPAIGKGAVIPGNGGFDYYGNTVSASEAPNIGAYNGTGLDPAELPEPPVDDLRQYFQGLQVTPIVDKNGGKSLQVRFANSSDTNNLSVGNISWNVGTGNSALSGTKTNLSPIGPNAQSTFAIPLVGLSEGIQYPLEMTVEVAGFEKIHLSRKIDFNRILHESSGIHPNTIDLADGNKVLTTYNGDDDLSGTVKLRWDSNNFYLTADIKDDVFFHEASGISIWQNDGIQFSVAPGVPGESQSWYEYGISQTPNGPQIYRWLTMQGKSAGAVTNGALAVTRDEVSKITSYRLALPWSELYPIRPAADSVLSFSMVVNDNDGSGRKGYIEWGSGIGAAKDPVLFRNVQLMGPDDENGTPIIGNNGSGESSPNSIDKGTIHAKGLSIDNGVVQVDIGSEEIKKALESVQDGQLVISVGPGEKNVLGAAVHLPADGFKEIGNKAKSIVVKANGAVVSFPAETLAGSIPADSKRMDISIVQVDSSLLPSQLKEKSHGYPVYDLSVKVDGAAIHSFGGGAPVTVTMKYDLKPGENPHQIVVYFIGEDGRFEVVKNGKYEPSTGVITFQPKHFSRYGAAYANVRFTDLKNNSSTIIEALAAREIIKGTGKGKFEPNRPITRGEFVQLLATALDLAPGIGEGGSFGGSEAITREEMATIVFRAWGIGSKKTATGGVAEPFKDQSQIGSYAMEAIEALRNAGIVNGYADGSYKPKGMTTRAEAAAIIYRLMGM